MALTTNQAVASAARIIRTASVAKRNGQRVNTVKVGQAWRVIVLAASDIAPASALPLRRDQALVIVGLGGKDLYGGSAAPGFGGAGVRRVDLRGGHRDELRNSGLGVDKVSP